MKIDIISVPYHLGQEQKGVGQGPARYIEAGAEQRFVQQGFDTEVTDVRRKNPFIDELSAITDVDASLGQSVQEVVKQGGFPLVLAGDCNSCLGTLAGFDASSTGIIWFDAHGDFNTPETSPTGFFDGMGLAIAAGRCHQALWENVGNQQPIPESQILLLGTRDLDPEEKTLLESSSCTLITAESLINADLEAVLSPAFAALSSKVRDIYIHLDIDVIDPEEAPGAGFTCPNGLSANAVEQVIHLLAERFQIRAASMTNFAPAKDRDEQTLQTGLRLLEVLARTQNLDKLA